MNLTLKDTAGTGTSISLSAAVTAGVFIVCPADGLDKPLITVEVFNGNLKIEIDPTVIAGTVEPSEEAPGVTLSIALSPPHDGDTHK